jgi:CBS domain-containing protein
MSIRACNKNVVTVTEDANLNEVAKLMHDKNIGSVVIIAHKDNPIPKGIITDRDIVTRIIGEEVKLDEVSIKDVSSQPLVVVKEEQNMQETLDAMSKNGIRRVPVINKEGKLVGLISLDDLLINLIEKLNSLSMLLKKQIA